MKQTGIYKIILPNGRVYIGQSRDLVSRFKAHRHSQTEIGKSIREHGLSAHQFLVIHELPIDVSTKTLEQYEDLYISQYRKCGVNLINQKRGGLNGQFLYYSWLKGVKLKHGHVEKIRIASTGRLHTEEAKKKISITHIGVLFDEQHRQRLSLANKDRNKSPEQQAKAKEGHERWMRETGREYRPKEKVLKGYPAGFNHYNARIILHTGYGSFFTLKEAAFVQGVSFQQMWTILNGWKGQRNYTKFIYT